MHNIKLWSPNNKKTNLHKFINQLDKSLNIKNYADLHNWSIKHKNEFWTNVWDFTNFVGEKKGKIFKSAPEFINVSTISKYPFSLAANRAVLPYVLILLTNAPLSIKSLTIGK